MAKKMSCLLVALLTGHTAFAEQGAAAWQGNAALSFSRATGNTNGTIFSAAVDEVRSTPENKISLFGSALYGNSQGKKTTDKLRAGSRYDHNLSADYFGFGLVEFNKESLANLSLRSTVGAGLGYYLIKNAANTFDVFAGLGYSQAKFIVGNQSSGAEFLFGEESTHQLTDTTRLKQKLTYTPSLQASGQFRAIFESGLVTDISNTIALSISLQNQYENNVAAGVKRNDAFLLTGLNIKF